MDRRLLAALCIILVVLCVFGAAGAFGAADAFGTTDAFGANRGGCGEGDDDGTAKPARRVHFNPVVQVREIERIGTRKIPRR